MKLALATIALLLTTGAFAATDPYDAAWDELEASYAACFGKEFQEIPFDPAPNQSPACVRYEKAIVAVEAVMGEE